MKLIRLIVLVCITAALFVPMQAIAADDETYFMSVNGKVYNAAFPAAGAKVTLYSYDGKLGDAQGSITTGADGRFSFKNIMFSSSEPVEYAVKADREGSTAYALVLFYPPGATADEPAQVEWINLDIASEVPGMRGDLTAAVWSTETSSLNMNTGTNLAKVPNAKLLLYKVDQDTGNLSEVKFSTQPYSDTNGQYVYPSLPYGHYYLKAEKNGKYGDQYFWLTLQEKTVNIKTNIDVPKTTPTPVPGASATPKPSGTQPTPGFEGIAALVAIAGVFAVCLRKA